MFLVEVQDTDGEALLLGCVRDEKEARALVARHVAHRLFGADTPVEAVRSLAESSAAMQQMQRALVVALTSMRMERVGTG